MVTAARADPAGATTFLARADLGALVDALHADGRAVVAPTVHDGAIVYDEIASAADLPIGWRDEQAPGHYRIAPSDDERAFGYAMGPTSWKGYTFPSRVPIGRARRDGERTTYEPVEPEARPLAFLGVRGCELAALRVQDRILMDGPVADPDYAARRRAALVVAVECTVAGATCFCTSMGTGPEIPGDDADLVLTELDDGFLVRAATPAGREVADRLPLTPASEDRVGEGRAAVAAVREAIGDPVAVEGLPGRLMARLDDPRWAEIAERCLACANCTLVSRRASAQASARSPIWTASTRSPSGRGTRAFPGTLRKSRAATSGRAVRTAIANG